MQDILLIVAPILIALAFFLPDLSFFLDGFNKSKEEEEVNLDNIEDKEVQAFLKGFNLKIEQMFLNYTPDDEKTLEYIATQKELNKKVSTPFRLQVKIICNKLFNNPFATMGFSTVVLQIIAMSVIAFCLSASLILPTLLPAFILLLSTIPICNFTYSTIKNELSIMESNYFLCSAHYGKYVSSATFIDSLRTTYGTFSKNSREYNITKQVYESMVYNNLPLDLGLRLWGKLMLADDCILKYLDTITKCENSLQEYKESMPMILERSRDLKVVKQEHLANYSYFLVLSIFSVFLSFGILYYLRYFSADPNSIKMFTTPAGTVCLYACFLIQFCCVIATLVLNKPIKYDKSGYDEIIRKRVNRK